MKYKKSGRQSKLIKLTKLNKLKMRKVILKGPYRIKKVKNKLSGLETKLKEN